MSYDVKTLRPLRQNVLVRRLQPEEKTAGGLFLPRSRGEKSLFCELIAVGDGKTVANDDGTFRKIPATLKAKPGDIVVVRQFEGQQLSNLHSDKKDMFIIDGRCIQGIQTTAPWPSA